MLRVIKKYRGGSFLDIGCAFGYLVNYAAPYFDDAVGLDISAYAISIAKQLFPNLDFKIGDIAKMPFADKSFSFITVLDTLEHTPDVKSSLTEIRRVLESGGVVLIRMPSYPHAL